jgi:hypothetical protein
MGGGTSDHRKAATYTQNNVNTIQTHIDIHASSGIPTHDPSVRSSEGRACLRPRGHYDRRSHHLSSEIQMKTGLNVLDEWVAPWSLYRDSELKSRPGEHVS